MQISLIASSVRECLYESFFDSLKDTELEWEAVFAGPATPKGYWPYLNYITTADIKPAQCYEIARRNAKGELILWCADDCEFVGGILDKAYAYWKSQNNEKLILSIQTKESGYKAPKGVLFDMNVHRFFGNRRSTPLMAPLGLINRKWLENLGGFDRRYICGQYENDVVMNAYADGGTVEIYGNNYSHIEIDHLAKSIKSGECDGEADFINRPFATGYSEDRKILEGSWTENGVVLSVRRDNFLPFNEENILTKSQEGSGKWTSL